MTDAIRCLAAVVPLLLLGLGLVLLLAAPRSRIEGARALAWSILFGAFGLTLLQFVCAFALRGRALRLTVLLSSLAVAGIGLLRARRREVALHWLPLRGRGDWVLLAAVAAELATVGLVIFHATLSWDAVVTMEARARPAWLNGGPVPLESYADAHRWWARPDASQFLPLLEAWLFGGFGRADERLVKALFAAFVLAAAALLWSAAREDRRWTLAPLIPIVVPQLIVGPASAASGDAAFPLAVVYLACALWLLGPGRGGGWRMLAALAAMLIWIAPDGVLLWMSVVIVAAWSADADRLRTAWRVAWPGILLLAAWNVFLHHAGAAGGMEAPPPSLLDLLDLTRWGLLWPLLLLCVPPLVPPEMRSGQRLLFACILVPLALWYAVALPGGGAWFASSMHVLVPLAFPAVLALSAAASAFADARRAAAPSARAGLLTAAALLATFALPGLEHTARAVTGAPAAGGGSSATIDALLAPTAIPSPAATVRGYIEAGGSREAVMFVGAGASSREIGTLIALLGYPRRFGGWVCSDPRMPPRPLPASEVAPETDGLLFVYRASGGAEKWMPGRASDTLVVVPAFARHLLPSPPTLCRPVAAVSRSRAALALSRRRHGDVSAALPATGVFRDVDGEAAAAAEELYRTGAVSGCAPRLFCPDRVVTRANLALFALAAAGALTHLPPATGVFVDVPPAHPLARHVERALQLGVPGCAEDPPRFCPDRPALEQELPDFLSIVPPSVTPSARRR